MAALTRAVGRAVPCHGPLPRHSILASRSEAQHRTWSLTEWGIAHAWTLQRHIVALSLKILSLLELAHFHLGLSREDSSCTESGVQDELSYPPFCSSHHSGERGCS